MQKVVTCNAEVSERAINKYLDNGWRVIHLIAEQISVSYSTAHTTDYKERKGLIVFVLEKES
jgi:hypothetical protein